LQRKIEYDVVTERAVCWENQQQHQTVQKCQAATVRLSTESEQRDLEQVIVLGSSAGLLT